MARTPGNHAPPPVGGQEVGRASSGWLPVVSFRLPIRFLRGNHGRLALTVLALALGVALVCAIDLVNRAVLRAFVEVVDTMAGRAALQITAGESGLFAEDVAATVAGVTGVELAVPVVSATAFTADDTGELLTIQGVDIGNEAAVRVYEARDAGGLEIEDPLVFLNQPDSIVLTRSFADRRHLRLDDQIALDTTNGRRVFTVRGLLEPEGIARVYGGRLAVMDLYAAEQAFTRPGFINRVDVVVKREATVGTVADAVRAVLPQGFEVTAPAQRKADLHKVMQSLQVLLTAMGSIGLIAGFFMAFNRLSTVFESRLWQLGMMRAVGVTVSGVRRELLKESMLLGVAGVLAGIPLGIGLARLFLPLIAETTALNYQLVAPEAALALSPVSLVLAALLGLVCPVVAAALPASRAARVSVSEILRGRGVEPAALAKRMAWPIRIAVGAAIVAGLMLQSASRWPGWGLMVTALLAVGSALAARPVLRLMSHLIQTTFGASIGPTLRFATSDLVDNERRAGLTIAMLSVGIGSVLWLWVVGTSFEYSVRRLPAFTSDLVIASAHVASGFLESPVDEALLDETRAVPGVGAAASERVIDWRVDIADQGILPVAIDAFDGPYFTTPELGRWPLLEQRLADPWPAVARGEAVVLSSNLVLKLGARVSDTITLQSPTGPVDFRVAGVTNSFISPDGAILMAREVFKSRWGDARINRVFVNAARGADPATLRQQLERQLGRKHRLRIMSSADLGAYWADQARRAFQPVTILAVVVFLVVLFGVADTLAAGLIERTRELGVISAIGVRRGIIRNAVRIQALQLGILGLLLAASTGLAMGVLWVRTTFPYLLGWLLELHLPLVEAGLVAAVTLAVCLGAAVIPARWATRLAPAEALRQE